MSLNEMGQLQETEGELSVLYAIWSTENQICLTDGPSRYLRQIIWKIDSDLIDKIPDARTGSLSIG